MAVELPEGFVLDEEQSKPVAKSGDNASSLPEGFVLDNNQDQSSGFSMSNYQPNKEQIAMQSLNPIKDYTQSIIKGYAGSAEGVNNILAGVSSLINSPIYDTTSLKNSYSQNAKYWKGIKESAEKEGATNWTLETLASLPINVPMFGTMTNPISIVAASGVYSAVEDYGKEIQKNPEANIDFENIKKGLETGAMTAGVIGGVTFTGAAIENVAKLIQKHGVGTVKNMFSAINGGDERMGARALELLSDPQYDKKAVLGDVGTMVQKHGDEIEKFKEATVDKISDIRKTASNEIFERNRDFDFNIRQLENEIKSDINLKLSKVDSSIEQLRNTSDLHLKKLAIENKDELGMASMNVDSAIKDSQQAVQEYMDSVFTGMYKKIESLKNSTGEALNQQWNKLIEVSPNEGASASSILERISKADAGENLFNFSSSGSKVYVKSKTDNQQIINAAKQIELELNAAIKTNILSESNKVNANTMKVTHDLFDNAARMPADQGSILPGIGKVYERLADAFHVKNYAEQFSPKAKVYVDDIINLGKKYGDYKDKLAETYAPYFKKEGDNVVPKAEIFNKFDRDDALYIRRLKEADMKLAPQDRVFDKVKTAYDSFNYIRDVQEKSHMNFKKRLDYIIDKESRSFNVSISNLRANRSMLESNEVKAMSDTLFAIKQTNDAMNKQIRNAFDSKIKSLAKSRAEALRELRSGLADEQLTLETKHMLRSLTPKAGVANIMQKIGLYGVAGGSVGLATGYMKAGTAIPMILGKGLMAVAASPKILANVSRYGIKNKEAIRAGVSRAEKTGAVMNRNSLLRRLIAVDQTKN